MIHQAAEMQSENDQLKDVLKKVKRAEEVIAEQSNYQKVYSELINISEII